MYYYVHFTAYIYQCLNQHWSNNVPWVEHAHTPNLVTSHRYTLEGSCAELSFTRHLVPAATYLHVVIPFSLIQNDTHKEIYLDLQ